MSVCYYDLETTGVNPPDHRGVEIIRIGATTSNGPWAMGDFEVFIQPNGPIDPRATRYHGMFKRLGDGRLVNRSNRCLITADCERRGLGFAGLEMFLHWLHQADCKFLVRFSSLVKYSQQRNFSSTFLQVAHNNSKFDDIVLRQNLAQHQLQLKGWFDSTVIAIDSITFVKKRMFLSLSIF